MKKNIITVRGGGDIATGTIYKLHQSGYPVLVTEIANPSAIRRQVAFSEAVYEKSYTVEGVTCYFASRICTYKLTKKTGDVIFLFFILKTVRRMGANRQKIRFCKKKSWDYNRYGTIYGCTWSRIYGRSGRACGC